MLLALKTGLSISFRLKLLINLSYYDPKSRMGRLLIETFSESIQRININVG